MIRTFLSDTFYKFFCHLKIYNYLCNDDSSIHSRIYDIYTKGVYSKRFVLDESKLRNFQVQSTNIATVDVLGMCIYAHPLLLIWHIANVYVSNIGIGGGVPLHIGVDLALLVQLYWAMRRPRFVGRVMRMVPTPFLFLSTTKTKNIPTASQGDSLQKRCN